MTERGDTRNDWLELAACRGNTYWMYGNVVPETYEGNELDPAQQDEVALKAALCYCDQCPVIDECEDTVMDQERGLPLEERFGVTAAMTPHERWVADGSPVGSHVDSQEE